MKFNSSRVERSTNPETGESAYIPFWMGKPDVKSRDITPSQEYDRNRDILYRFKKNTMGEHKDACSFCLEKDCKGYNGLGFGIHFVPGKLPERQQNPPEEKVHASLEDAYKSLLQEMESDPDRFPIKFTKKAGIVTVTLRNKSFNSKRSFVVRSHYLDDDYEEAQAAAAQPDNYSLISGKEEATHFDKYFSKDDPEDVGSLPDYSDLDDDTPYENEFSSFDSGPERIDKEEDNLVCPTCTGMSKHNTDGNHIFTGDPHCSGCSDDNCSGSKTTVGVHCPSCKNEENCDGKKRYEWVGENKEKVCPTCNNSGEITFDQMRAIELAKHEGRDPLELSNSSSFVDRDKDAEGVHEEQYDKKDLENPIVQSTLPESSNKTRASTEVFNPQISSAILNRIQKRKLTKEPDVNLAITGTPTSSAEVKHGKSCKCNGTGRLGEKEIGDLINTDDYKKGIANIVTTFSGEEKKRKLAEFVKQQYACKGE